MFVLPACQESESLKGTLSRCRSMLSDWGTESRLWQTPSSILEDELPSWNTLFGMALPIPDHDHSLHHVSRPD